MNQPKLHEEETIPITSKANVDLHVYIHILIEPSEDGSVASLRPQQGSAKGATTAHSAKRGRS
jgi:hypothetical protein